MNQLNGSISEDIEKTKRVEQTNEKETKRKEN